MVTKEISIGERKWCDRMGIHRTEKALRYIRTEVGDLPIQQLEMFLAIACEEGISQVDLVSRCDMLPGTVSRNVKRLSHKMVESVKGEFRNIGYGLIESRLTGEGRRESLHLTPRGREIFKDFIKILQL